MTWLVVQFCRLCGFERRLPPMTLAESTMDREHFVCSVCMKKKAKEKP